MDLCRFSGVFGEPGKGAHRHRVAGFAAVDLFATAFVAMLLTLLAGKGRRFSPAIFLLLTVVLLVVGIVAHRVFCVNTRLNTLIFGRV